MSRKKVSKKVKAKRTAPTAKRATKKANTSNTLHALEKSFKEIPAKVIAHCRKEIAGLKLQEKKVQADLKKSQLQHKTNQKKFDALTTKHTSKPTATTKKQLSKQKQSLDKLTKLIAGLDKRHTALKTESHTASQQHQKQTALHKLVSTFEKDWKASARQDRQEVAAKPSKKIKATKKPTAPKSDHHHTTHTFEEETTHHVTNPDVETIE